MTRKILASLLVIGAVVAAVAGLTFAIFSDNVHSDEQAFDAGTVDIEVNEDVDDYFETTVDMENMEPGDCATPQTITVHNAGTLPVYYWTWIYPHGDIFSCDPNPSCNMQVWYDGPDDLTSPYALGLGETETLSLNACLPLCAGNNCQGADGYFRMFIHAVQQSNLDGWNCVKLLHKEGPDWLPDPDWTWDGDPNTLPAHGNKCYEDEVGTGPNVEFVVNGYNMTPNMPLQIMLNGPGGCSDEDKIIAGDFDLDGDVDPGYYDAYYRGFWTGTAMSSTCSGTGEGVYAIAQGGGLGGATPDPAAVTDAAGNFSGQWTAYLDACASQTGSYTLQTKFLIKQDASPWNEELDELDYQYITFTCGP